MTWKYEKYVVLWESMMVCSPVGIGYYFGNLSTYVFSLHFKRQGLHVNSSNTDLDPAWMLPCYFVSNGMGMLLVDVLKALVGHWLTLGTGIALFLIGSFTSYFAVCHSIWATTLTFMFAGGVGNGLVTTMGLMYVVEWFKPKEGLASGLLCGASALGGIVMNAVITSYINSQNLSPDTIQTHMRFFSQPSVIDRVPEVFLVIGILGACFQVTGFCFLRTFRPEDPEQCVEETLLLGNKHGARNIKEPMDTLLPEFRNETKNESSLLSSISLPNRKFSTVILKTANDDSTTSCDGSANSKEVYHMAPLQFVKSEIFHILILAVVSQTLALLLVANYFKLFGQLWISDDYLLALAGSCFSFCAVIFIPGCGTLIDSVGIKNAFIIYLSANTLLLSVWYFTAGLSKWLYIVCVVLLFGVNVIQNILWSITVMRYCGTRHFATNFGLLHIGGIVVDLFGPPVIVTILSALGWFWLFYINAIMSFMALVMVIWRMPSR